MRSFQGLMRARKSSCVKSMSNPLIQLNNVSRAYGDGVITLALRGITLEIEKGEFVAIMGPSGSGKSTLMHVMGFLDTISSGSYFFEGRDVGKLKGDELSKLRLQEVGFVFQAFNLLQKSTVFQNVQLPLLYGSLSDNERKDGTDAAIKAVSMEYRRDHFSSQLSGGEKQRVAIARAIVNKPSVIFADEPTGNLDSKNGTQILELLAGLHNGGKTIVMVTHEEEAAQYASRILRMRDGLVESNVVNLKVRRGNFSK